MKQYKEENPGCLKLALIFLIFLAVSILFFSCSSQKEMPQYKVTSVSKIKGHNAYIIETDSFKVVRVIRGGFNYKPKTISKQGYKL